MGSESTREEWRRLEVYPAGAWNKGVASGSTRLQEFENLPRGNHCEDGDVQREMILCLDRFLSGNFGNNQGGGVRSGESLL